MEVKLSRPSRLFKESLLLMIKLPPKEVTLLSPFKLIRDGLPSGQDNGSGPIRRYPSIDSKFSIPTKLLSLRLSRGMKKNDYMALLSAAKRKQRHLIKYQILKTCRSHAGMPGG